MISGGVRESVSALVGRKAFEAMVRPTQLIRNIVATVDNLPRETAPTRVLPFEPVRGRFAPGPAYDTLYDFFRRGNGQTLEMLRDSFEAD